jgi:hypothetical protein
MGQQIFASSFSSRPVWLGRKIILKVFILASPDSICDDLLDVDDAVAEEDVQISDSAKHIEAWIGSNSVAEPFALIGKIVVLIEKVTF